MVDSHRRKDIVPTAVTPSVADLSCLMLVMASYPILEISLDKVRQNTHVVVGMCHERGIRVAGVTKGFCGHPSIARAMVDGGVDMLADSRVQNLMRLRELQLPKLMLRLPMLSEVDSVVDFADISLVTEIDTIKALARAAHAKRKRHQVILMYELGDLREGIVGEIELLRILEAAAGLDGVVVVGLGTNLTCYGGVLPTTENLSTLTELRGAVESRLHVSLDVLSGGNSSSLYLVEAGNLPEGINLLRLGESIVLGRETAYGRPIRGTHDDCFRLIAEIIEVKAKPSLPDGEVGHDAFGKKPRLVDKGIRIKAICAIGRQDVTPEHLLPEDGSIEILGASSDHLILDVTECRTTPRVGDLVAFKLTYPGILQTMTSGYVSKRIQ